MEEDREREGEEKGRKRNKRIRERREDRVQGPEKNHKRVLLGGGRADLQNDKNGEGWLHNARGWERKKTRGRIRVCSRVFLAGLLGLASWAALSLSQIGRAHV